MIRKNKKEKWGGIGFKSFDEIITSFDDIDVWFGDTSVANLVKVEKLSSKFKRVQVESDTIYERV